jgi:MFS family permease
MMSTVRAFRYASRAVQVLVVNQLFMKVGFYMLMPYLATHLTSGLGTATWVAGLVLGVRSFSQQGLFVVGGMLTDRYGARRLVIAGCALRTVGFGMLGVVTSLPALLIAAALTGLAGALFSPAVRGCLSEHAGERRLEVYALSNVFRQAGVVVGPLAGLALMALNFQCACAVSAALFLALTILQVRTLPRAPYRSEAARAAPLRGCLPQILRNRAFLFFSVAMTGSYVLSFQVYLAVPLQVRRVLGPHYSSTGMTILLVLSAAVVVLGQVRATAWAQRRWTPSQALVRGLLLMGAGFLPLALSAASPYGDLDHGLPEVIGTPLDIAPTTIAVLLLAVGGIVTYPFELEMIGLLSQGRYYASYYGMYNTISGIGMAIGDFATGAAWDAGHHAHGPSLLWFALVALGLLSACGIAAVARAHPLRTQPIPQP